MPNHKAINDPAAKHLKGIDLFVTGTRSPKTP
ncbi:hypothetical protein GGR39_003454, partial [Novosphingobium fluoreni]|nr:hypothetical protein [Novosphingobium fluoreni]